MRTHPTPFIIAMAARKARSSRLQAAGVPLYLPTPEYREPPTSGYGECDAEEPVEAAGITIGGDEDDDFY